MSVDGGKTPSLAARMESLGGPSRGFDYLRIGLALCVVFWHAILVCYGVDQLNAIRAIPWVRPLHNAVLPMFFALSGFLVTGSLLRNSLAQFVSLRALRIVPALAVEVTLSAVLLGAVFTTLPLDQYFTSPVFASYFLNIVGEIHYQLPGVFQSNPFPDNVNTQLWTIPFELACYVLLLTLAVLRVIHVRWLFLGVLVVGVTGLFIHHKLTGVMPGGHDGEALVASFCAGVGVYLFKDKLPFDWRWALAAGLAAVPLLTIYQTHNFAALPLAYFTVWLGLNHPPKSLLTASGDLSYGVYLFSVPIQQAIAQYAWTREWWINLALCLPVSFAFAALSWRFVEKPALGQRKRVLGFVSRIEKAVGGFFSGLAAPAARPVQD